MNLGQPHPLAYWSAVFTPVLHQIFVWWAWRSELQSQTVSRVLGFRTYLIIFFAFLLGRVVTLFALAWADSGSLQLATQPRVLITAMLLLVWGYLAYSVKRYFGFERAAGADHFDASYREMPLVKQGIFQVTSNGMYTFGFLILWAIAIGLNSISALAVAFFSHAYIWVHFYCTELPDMDYLYSQRH